MDCRLQTRVKTVVEELAREHYAELTAAGTLVDLEELTCQIGDEVTRLLTERELTRRGQEDVGKPAECPDCGRSCLPDTGGEPVLLTGLRGTLAYTQPKHFCDRCRRSFFPSSRPLGPAAAEHGHDQVLQKAIWAGANNGSYPMAAEALVQLAQIRAHDQADSSAGRAGGPHAAG
jgi:hypothetical protein